MNQLKIKPSENLLRLLSILNIFSKPIQKNIISDLMGIPLGELDQMAEVLEQLGWLKQHDGWFSLTSKIPKSIIKKTEIYNSQDWLNKLLERLQRLVDSRKTDPTHLFFLLKKAGREKEAAAMAYHCALSEIEGCNFATALDYCRQSLSILNTKIVNEDSDNLLVKVTLTFSDLCCRLRRDHILLPDLLCSAMAAAIRLGDQRHLALTHLHLGRAYALMHMNNEAIKSLSQGLDLVEKIGDRDIIMRSAEFYGHFYFMKGLCKEAADYCEMALSRCSLDYNHVSGFMTPVLLALSSAGMGQFHRAIGVMDSSWRRALLNSDNFLAAYYRTFLGQMLIMYGRIEEGASHLYAAERDALSYDDTYTMLWLRRIFAYYYYLKGEDFESYYCLETALNLSHKIGLRRPFYALPWVLELLFHFHQKGFSPLSDYPFEHEIQLALKGPNALLRGTALRILAKQSQEKEENLTEVERLLSESESELMRAGASIEIAKTRSEMALIKLKQGDKKGASELALKAWEAWSSLNHESFPKELRSLIEWGDMSGSQKLDGKDILSRYLELIDRLSPSANLDDMLNRLISDTCQFFEAERGGFFTYKGSREGQEFVLRTGYNLTQEQVNSEEFRFNLQHIAHVYESNEPLVIREPKVKSTSSDHQIVSILCVPFEVLGKDRGILYYDKLYLDGAFDVFNKNTISQITKSLGNYINNIYHYSKQMEIKSREALSKVTVNGQNGVEVFEGLGEAFQDLLYRIETVARSDVSVLILGETGVGKELLAKRIHLMSPRNRGPFVPINPSCIPESLVDSELFGHEKGAFTGADHAKPGWMELAHKGTLFIDEIGEIPKSIQVKLLRALEEKAFVRVGGVLKREVDFRLITATNRDLVKEVEAGHFRQDLYYRLCVVTLKIPPLRERGDDVIKLAQEFLFYYAKRYNRPPHLLNPEEKMRLKAYHWPGNIRELRNVIEQSVIMSSLEKFELIIPRAPNTSTTFREILDNLMVQKPTIEDLERRYIKFVLQETKGRIGGPSGAAKILGLKRTTLYKRMQKLGLRI